ncbi:MAG: creatininase family protein [Chloroflexi bacterium AL-W]|nr:creatininase family protein [Chloroflexi bacterium AL-N1]NOK70619.1 creatininase family protein [Chloroflexi bacterium AL-N10]NOK77611.1 creatininase family protein [Chloroflexi bacterium AL-N5]NOK84462.1 creatininase family protein [Chloroflexi bacterium AL-W]NOK92351.1 creatininase family protein [Chloroflexi bacterium AL-N15]
MTDTSRWGRYTELGPVELAAIVDATPLAYVPWGALEWHGAHLPFGVDGFIAEAVCEGAAQRTGGIVLPTTWWPITALPHRFSLSVQSDTVQALWDGIFSALAQARFRVVILISGHYAQGHELVLMDAAEYAMTQYNLLVLAVPPMALVDENMLDHAAHWETALMQAVHPRLVHLEYLEDPIPPPTVSAILGQDPHLATPQQGESALRLATERIVASASQLLQQGHSHMLHELYSRRRARYRAYVEHYFRGSWEEAIQSWWSKQS